MNKIYHSRWSLDLEFKPLANFTPGNKAGDSENSKHAQNK